MSIDKGKLTKEVNDKYSLVNETFSRCVKDNPKDRIDIEVGDSKEPDFKPQFKVMRWDNEVNLSFRLKGDGVEQEIVDTVGDKIVWKKGKREAHFYDIQNAEHPEGAYEFEITLLEKPDTNKVEFSLNTKGLDFFYQPELTPEEIAEGAERPENVVGSYAVYASEQKVNYVGGKEYKVGKVGHIFRPQIEDANGNKVWGELNVDTETGTLTVTIPQEFLDNAVYPVTHAAGLTFGYTTTGGSILGFIGSDQIRGTKGIPASAGTVSKISAYLDSSDGVARNVQAGLYLDSSNALLSPQSGSVSVNAANTYDFSVSISVTAVNYYVTLLIDTNPGVGGARVRYDTAGAASDQSILRASLTFPTWPDPSGATDTAAFYTIYATYLATGFPVVESVTDTDITSSLTSHVVNMPATVDSGDRLIALAHYRNAGTWSTIPTGWSNLAEQAGGGSVGEMLICEKIADGSEGGTTATWVTGTGTTAAWQVIRISGAHASTASEVGTTSGDSSAADPPSKTISGWTGENTLWIAAAGHSASSTSAWSSGSIGFSGFSSNGASSGGSACCVAHCYDTDSADTVNPGAFTVSGSNRWWSAATIAVRPAAAGGSAYDIVASTGSFTESGQSANLSYGTNVASAVGEYALTGQSAGLSHGQSVASETGAYSVTGQSTGLSHNTSTAVENGSYSVAGQDSGFTYGTTVLAGNGGFTLTGQTANFSHSVLLALESGMMTLTGNDVLFTSGYVIGCPSGSYTVSGQDANFNIGLIMSAGTGAYTVTGQGAVVSYGVTFNASSGTFGLSGYDANVNTQYVILTSSGGYILTGQDAAASFSQIMGAENGTFDISGIDTSLAVSYRINPESGTFTLTGKNVLLDVSTPSAAGNIIIGIAI